MNILKSESQISLEELNNEIKKDAHCPLCYYSNKKDILSGKCEIKEINKRILVKCFNCEEIFDLIYNPYIINFIDILNKLQELSPTESLKEKKRNEIGYIYINKCDNKYKIGKTKDIKKRIKTYITENPNNVECVYYSEFKNYHSIENDFIKHFKEYNLHHEWFMFDDLMLLSAFEFLEQRKLENNEDIKGDKMLKESMFDTGLKINSIVRKSIR